MRKQYMTPRKKKDIVCKAAFAEWFIDFLRFLYPDADQVFDLDRGAEAMEKELLEILPDRERHGGTLLADLLMKVYLRDGTEQWLLVHVELENRSEEGIARRVWGYYIRLVDKYPVPIIPIVVFTGGPRQKRPSTYRFSMLGVSVDFRFKAYHVFDHTMDELLANPNPMALVILACQAEAQERKLGPWRLNEIKKRIVEGLVERGITDTGQIMRFIRFKGTSKSPVLSMKASENTKVKADGKIFRKRSSATMRTDFCRPTQRLVFAAACNRKGALEVPYII